MKELGSIYAKGRLGVTQDRQEAARYNEMAENSQADQARPIPYLNRQI